MKIIIHNISFILAVLTGFCLIVNRPLMAQAPGGDDGNHKDKPGYKTEATMETEIDKFNKSANVSGHNMDLQFSSMSIKTLIMNIWSARDKKEKRHMAGYLAAKKPASKAEIDALFDFIRDTDKDSDLGNRLSERALNALLNVTDKSFISEFTKRLKKGSLNERRAAILSMAEFKYANAVPDLIDILNEPFGNATGDEHQRIFYLQTTAVHVLGIIGDPRAIPAMLNKLGKMEESEIRPIAAFGNQVLLQLVDIYKNSKDSDRKDAACQAISLIKDKESTPFLWKALQEESDPDLKFAYMNALLGTTNEQTRPNREEVIEYLFNKMPEHPILEYTKLYIAKDKENIPYLVEVLKNPDNSRGIKTEAIILLGKINNPAAVHAIEGALHDTDESIKRQAAETLKKITGKDYH